MLKSRRRYHIAADPARKRQKAESHARILAAARTLFVRRGYDATTARDIAERAGLSVGTLFLHFKSKADILKTIIWVNNEAQYDLMRASRPDARAGKGKTAAHGRDRLRARSRAIAARRGRAVLSVAMGCGDRARISRYDRADHGDDPADPEDGIRSGEIRSDADLETTIECLIASHVWNFRAALFAGADVATLTERAGRTIDVLIDGLRPRNGTPAAGPTPA